MALMIACPVTPLTSLKTLANCIFICVSVFCILCLPLSIEAAFVPGDALPLMPYLYVRGIHLDLHFDADWEWNRIEVGQHAYAAAGVHMGKMNRCQVEALFGESAQMFAFRMHPCANRLGPLPDHPLLVLLRGFLQQNIQLFPTRYLRHRHQVVATKITTFTLHTTLLVSFSWRTKLRRKTPVRPEGNESRGLLALISPQNLLHRTLEVIVAKRRKYSAEIGERQLVCFEK